jgi:hypothetical protein
MVPAFEIVDITTPKQSAPVVVDGRALVWFRAGTTLYLENIEPSAKESALIVLRIEAYRRQLQEIGPTWACRLHLQGSQYERLYSVTHLYIEESDVATRATS